MSKSYCLKCEKPNQGCNCNSKEFTIYHSDKLRVPLSTKNKAKFRLFLDQCPIFPNLVPEHLQPHFRDFLRKLKYYGKTINGFKFTNVHKNEKYETNLYK
jgi:hypothetical protein